MNNTFLLVSTAVVFILTGCGVSHEFYAAAVSSRDSLALTAKNCEENLRRTDVELANSRVKAQTLESDLISINQEYNDIKNRYKTLKNSSSEDIQNLLGRVEIIEKDLNNREKKIRELQRAVGQRDSLSNALKTSLAAALFGFKSMGLDVSVRDGKVYVSLPNQLLFQSGSSSIDKKGQEALKMLAEALSKQPNISIMVEGHTDNAQVKPGSKYADNWDLSVLRSTEVVRYLTLNNVDPKRISASGRGEYFPVQLGDSPLSRAANRRTEIIVKPNLEKIYDILEE